MEGCAGPTGVLPLCHSNAYSSRRSDLPTRSLLADLGVWCGSPQPRHPTEWKGYDLPLSEGGQLSHPMLPLNGLVLGEVKIRCLPVLDSFIKV